MHKFVDTPLKAQLGAWLGGVVIVFTDLGTALLVGPVFRPLFDKLKLSREKLAWVLDSTSSPVAVLIPFIGWGVYIMGLIEAQFKNLQVNVSDYETFMQAIPFQFYTILAVLIPACIFLFGTVISFSTGSSWGTFAILMPLAIPMGHAFGIPYAICVGAVLSGGLFGDHCSPLSDTTILSSMGAECNLADHVRTQLPYAAINGVIAFVGFIIAGLTGSAISTVIAVALLLAVIFGWNYYDRKHTA